MKQEFLLDITINATLHINAESQAEAVQKIQGHPMWIELNPDGAGFLWACGGIPDLRITGITVCERPRHK